ncbi:MAG: imidazole glycerol phosphate synthase subunit HisF [Rhodospirillaceae bacterium]|nr:imidazole glycerol phosphate synthase subunit HisF [Rhodospirillaceae bacterium]
MLKRRIIPVELLLNDRLVKTVAFGKHRDVGDPLKSSQVYYNQDADELILLNIGRNQRSPRDTANHLRNIAKKCFMPITVGGGITSIEDASMLFNAGADKVVINSAGYDQKSLLEQITERYGSQALVVSIDVRNTGNSPTLFSDCGRCPKAVSLTDHIKQVIDCGAGEIFLNAIDRDGIMGGYDLDLLDKARKACRVPLIICGGAGHYLHMREAFNAGAAAVACGSLFNFGDNNPLRAKAFLKNYNIPLKRT